MDALQLCGGPFSGSSHRGTGGEEEGPFVLGGKGGDSVQGGGWVGVRNEEGLWGSGLC